MFATEMFLGKIFLTNSNALQVLQGHRSTKVEQKQSVDRTEGTQETNDSEESDHHSHRAHADAFAGFHEATGLATRKYF